MAKPKSIETLLAQAGARRDPHTGALSTPIYQTASFAHAELGLSTGYDYSRTSNPTRHALEEALTEAEGGARACAFASGLAAIDALLRLFQPGDRLIVTEDLYGGTFRLFEQCARPFGLEAIYVDTSDTDAVRHAFAQCGAKGLFVESPTNPLLKVADLPALAELARKHNAVFIVDNTFLTPFLQKPLALGAHLTTYSATKYLAGHNDVVAGAVVAATPELGEKIAFYQNAVGGILGPMDCWLTLRGLKTLPLRLQRQQDNALRIAQWLNEHPRVPRVYYPGLSAHPGHHILLRDGIGFGGMIAFEVDEPARVPAILKNVQTFLFAESLGGVESLITYPLVQTHADMDAALLQRLNINDRLLRLSVGIEHVDDLIADLESLL
jgi:cystathionine gamma-synthase